MRTKLTGWINEYIVDTCDNSIQNINVGKNVEITQYDLMMQYGILDLGEYLIMQWLVAWWYIRQ